MIDGKELAYLQGSCDAYWQEGNHNGDARQSDRTSCQTAECTPQDVNAMRACAQEMEEHGLEEME